MASRCIIGKVDGQGDGKAILCSRGCYPDEAGAALLGRYSEEPLIDELIALGSIAWLEAEPKECEAHHRDRGYPWEHCQPHSFTGGTEAFFSEYWGPGPEWLYVWTPDGWLASPAMAGKPPQSYFEDGGNLGDPSWAEWISRTREAQRARPLYSVVADFQRSS